MAKHKASEGAEKKRRSKKRKSRLEVSDSESEGDGGKEIKRERKGEVAEEIEVYSTAIESPIKAPKKDKKDKTEKKAKKEKRKSRSEETSIPEPDSTTERASTSTARSSMTASVPAVQSNPPPSNKPKKQPPSSTTNTSSTPQLTLDAQFSAIYLRTLTAEFADDLDKVRSAPDFKENSVAMLVHALKQGEALFSEEEKRRIVGVGGGEEG